MSRETRPLRAGYIGYAEPTGNLGDEALIPIIRDLLAPEIAVTTDCPSPDIALLGGGTLINQSPWLIDAFADALDRAERGITLGTGVGDLVFWGDHFDRWVPLLRRCEFVGVRGPDSLALLHERGVDHAVCVGDPFLWIDSPAQRSPVLRRIGVNIGVTGDALWGTNDCDLQEFAVGALRQLRRRGWSFVWISVWSRDLPVMQILRESVDSNSEPVLDALTQMPETLSALARCEVFLGEKLHANALAAVASVPFVSLEYQPKVRDFAASLDMADWSISTAERHPGRLIGLIESLAGQRREAERTMVAARAVLRAQLAEHVAAIKAHFAAPARP